jgi:CRP/FNR family transcriptional regulator
VDAIVERARTDREHAQVLAPCPLVELAQGERARTRPDTALLIVERGAVALELRARGARRTVVVAVAGQGDVLLAPRRDEAVRALAPAALRVVDRESERRLLRTPAAAAALAQSLAAALRDREESLAQLAWPLHAERLRGKLLQLARRHGRVTRDGVRIDLPLTHQLLADAIGAARETVTVALRDLRRDGFLTGDGRSYVLKLGPEELGP